MKGGQKDERRREKDDEKSRKKKDDLKTWKYEELRRLFEATQGKEETI